MIRFADRLLGISCSLYEGCCRTLIKCNYLFQKSFSVFSGGRRTLEKFRAPQLVHKPKLQERTEISGGRALLAAVQHRRKSGPSRVLYNYRGGRVVLASRFGRIRASLQVSRGRAAARRQPGRRENAHEHRHRTRKWYVFWCLVGERKVLNTVKYISHVSTPLDESQSKCVHSLHSLPRTR